ncbi:hypothetical protein B566_EDAN014624 [Ephemera danica]|nr:hypothetical protein B566_EDAN014624 [Ephemera danica]
MNMEQPISTENQTAMAPVYGNMSNLCLLCASAQNPEGQPFLDIHGQLGTQLKILEKIQKFLTITIEAGFPLQVCVSCVDKLNVCHEFVQSTEEAHEKLKSLQKEWETKQLTAEEPLDDIDKAWSPMDVNVPSPYYADFTEESQKSETEQHSTRKRKKKSKETSEEENKWEEYPMLQQPSILVKGSQTAIFVAEEDVSVKFKYSLGIILINKDEDCANNEEKEKINRILQLVKKR